MAFQEVMAHLQREVIQRFPTANFIAVAGFIFLRFFCPAISAPDAQDVVPTSQLNAQARRTLVLISKVIQCLANGTKFGQKEAFMHPCNPFIEANQAACNNFLATLSVCTRLSVASVLTASRHCRKCQWNKSYVL